MWIWKASKGLGLALLAGWLGLAHGQQDAGGLDDQRIRLEVQVATKAGEAVRGLSAGDFTLLDNGQPRAIESVREMNGRAGQVQVVVVLDGENASQEVIQLERRRMGTFLLEDGGKLKYPTSVALLSTGGVQMVLPTLDGKGLNDAMQKVILPVRALDQANSSAVFQQRVSASLRGLQQLLLKMRTEPGRKLVIFLSPGWPMLDDASVVAMGKLREQLFASVKAMSRLVREAGVTLYNVAPFDAGFNTLYAGYYKQFMKPVTDMKHVEAGDVGLQVVAIQSGGRVDELNDGETDYLKRDVGDADHYYEVTFAPAGAAPVTEYHALQVNVAGGAVTRTRTGYYTTGGRP